MPKSKYNFLQGILLLDKETHSEPLCLILVSHYLNIKMIDSKFFQIIYIQTASPNNFASKAQKNNRNKSRWCLLKFVFLPPTALLMSAHEVGKQILKQQCEAGRSHPPVQGEFLMSITNINEEKQFHFSFKLSVEDLFLTQGL